MKEKFLKFLPGLVIMVCFYILAVVLWKAMNYPIFLANFIIVGTLVGLGFGLWPILKKENREIARKITMLLVGSYIFLGFGTGLMYLLFGYFRTENFQFEGFWFYLILGGFAGTVYHYTIAKIVGPFIFGRLICGWLCWTAAILDFLPWKNNKGRIDKRWEYFRYIHFFIGLALVLILIFVFDYSGIERTRVKLIDLPADIKTLLYKFITLKELWWFVIGNCLYYFIAVILAFVLKDNRAFCKYVCPITVFMKIGSRFSLFKIKTDKIKCKQCGTCEQNCMMNNKISDYTKEGDRVTSSECILCLNCVRVCPNNALSRSLGFDAGFRDRINRNKA
jgi:ferredoxin-type protein NapH